MNPESRFRAPIFSLRRMLAASAVAGAVALAMVSTSLAPAQAAPLPRASAVPGASAVPRTAPALAAVSAVTSTPPAAVDPTRPTYPGLAPATVVRAGQAVPADTTYPVITIGLNTITILLSPDNQKVLLQGGAVAGAVYGAELCIAAGYGDAVCAVAGFLIGAALVAFIQDKVSPKCNLQVVMNWSFQIIGWSYPDCPGGP